MTKPAPLAILRKLADMRLTSTLLAMLALETLLGTLMQAKVGLYAAQQAFFHNWFGVPLLGALGILNLSAILFMRLQWKVRNAGLIVLHLGILTLLLTAGFSWFTSETGFVELGQGESASRAESGQDWELTFRALDDSGATTWSIPLASLKPGKAVELGPQAPQVTVRRVLRNAVVNPDGGIIPVLSAPDPESWQPVLTVDVATPGQAPLSVSLSPARAPWSKAGAQLILRRHAIPLPFSLQLKAFKREYHPGTEIASSYESTVLVADKSGKRDVKISMNRPLRIGDFTVYQSSWSSDPGSTQDRSVFSVTRNPFRNGPYAATLLIALGLAWHVLTRMVRKPKRPSSTALLAASLLGLSALCPSPTIAATLPAPESLQRLPILVDGRVKPLETFAQQLLLQVSGKSSLTIHDGTGNSVQLDATQWLLDQLFSKRLDREPFFLVENPEARDALGLQGKERDRYSWKQLSELDVGPRLDSLTRMVNMLEPKNRTALQRDLLRISDSWVRVNMLRNAMGFLAPDSALLNIPPAVASLLPNGCRIAGHTPRNFLEFVQGSQAAKPLLDSLLNQAPDSLDPSGRAFLSWVNQVLLATNSWANAELAVVPIQREAKPAWVSPGHELLQEGLGNADLRKQTLAWAKVRDAWLTGNAVELRASADSLELLVQASLAANHFPQYRLALEHRYNQLEPFFHALLLYLFALLPALLGLRTGKARWIQAAAFLGLGAVALQAVGIGMRMAISGRPPVTNLYETLVFSGAASALILLVWGHFRKNAGAPLIAATIGASLSMLARRFGADGDSMPVLAAVLDSNFWLSVHVVTITLGYAAVVAAGAVAHGHLILLRSSKIDLARAAQESSTWLLMREILALGLLFTFVGTLLGGVWADQSWGRFWGWDPKENGALLIILWVAFLFHAMPAGLFGKRGFSLGTVFAIQTVLFAWFGVNLMGVGLHSYGFTGGTLYGLVGFAAVESGFVAWTLCSPLKPLK